jgi:hypothetical protein
MNAKDVAKAEITLGYDTVRHLDRWLLANFYRLPSPELAQLRRDMMAIAADAEEQCLPQGWWRVYDQATTD